MVNAQYPPTGFQAVPLCVVRGKGVVVMEALGVRVQARSEHKARLKLIAALVAAGYEIAPEA